METDEKESVSLNLQINPNFKEELDGGTIDNFEEELVAGSTLNLEINPNFISELNEGTNNFEEECVAEEWTLGSGIIYDENWKENLEGEDKYIDELVEEQFSLQSKVIYEEDWRQNLDGEETNMEEFVEKAWSSPTNVKMNSDWLAFLSGNEPFIEESKSSDENYEYENDWEEVSDSDENEQPSNIDRSATKSVDLKNGVEVTIPVQFYKTVSALKSEPWTVTKRNQALATLELDDADKMCTDIYDVVATDGRNSAGLTLPSACEEDIMISMEIQDHCYTDCYDYFANVKSGNCWKLTEARTMKIIPVDRDGLNWRLKKFPKTCNIVALSDCLYVERNRKQFKKPVTVQLPLDVRKDNYHPVFLRWNKERDTISVIDSTMNDTIMRLHDGCCKIMIESFSGYMAAIIRPGSLSAITQEETKIDMGRLELCTFLLFMKELRPRYISIWIEIVKKECLENVLKERCSSGLRELRLCRSSDVYLKDKDRIRIDLYGCVKLMPHIPKSYYIITMLKASRNNHIMFPAQVYHCMSGVPFVIVNYTDDKNAKKILHSAHFHPWVKKNSMQHSLSSHNISENTSVCNTQMEQNNLHASTESLNERPAYCSNLLHGSSAALNLPSVRSNLKESNVDVNGRQSPSSNNLNITSEITFSDQSMIKLASKLTHSQAYRLAVGLGVKTEEIDHIQAKSSEERNLKMLKLWLSREAPEKRINNLVRELKEIDLSYYGDVVANAFRQKKVLTMRDFEN